MVKLHEQLKYFVNDKVSNDPAWQGLRIYLSGHEVRGLEYFENHTKKRVSVAVSTVPSLFAGVVLAFEEVHSTHVLKLEISTNGG